MPIPIDEPCDLSDLNPDPFIEFGKWYAAAQTAGDPAPENMLLATASKQAKPSARMVLLRGFDARGFCFYTNYESRKGRELAENPHAALVLYWEPLGRQVRIEGTVERTSAAESEAYFKTRPLGSRLAAWASRQGAESPSREALEKSLAEFRAKFPGEAVPLPPYWGGYRVVPSEFEFWISRESRLHDRFRYRKTAGGAWQITRLAP